MKKTLKLIVLYSCLGITIAAMAPAGTCKLDTAGVAFGTYDPLTNSNRDGIGTITVTCSGHSGESISYSLTTDAVVQYGSYRSMVNGNHSVSYILYLNSAHTEVWGDGSAGSATINDAYLLPNSGQTSRSYSVYGRIPSGQTKVTEGTYTGAVTITLNY